MIKYTWSYSSMSTFKQCPRKYHRIKVVKDIKESETEATLYGTEVHKAAEEYIRDGTPIPAKFEFIKPYLDILNGIKGDKLCEYKMGLTKEVEPCEFFAENVWWRGVADLLVISGDTAFLIDYKTGKSAKYADTKQLELLAMAVFRHFPEVKNIKAGLLFVVSKEFVESEYNVEQQRDSWLTIFGDISMLEACYENDVWNAKPNFSCSRYCPVLDCEHNGMNVRR
jgi:hypothetical protein